MMIPMLLRYNLSGTTHLLHYADLMENIKEWDMEKSLWKLGKGYEITSYGMLLTSTQVDEQAQHLQKTWV